MRRFVVVLSVCLMVLALGLSTFAAKTTLTFWGFATNRNRWYEAMAAEYQKKNPDVEIKVVSIPYDEMHNKVLTTLVAGTGAPDIADIEISRFGQYVKGKKIGFMELNDPIGKDVDNLYFRSALAPWSWQGKYYGIGNELNACLMFYRWDLLQQAGIATPIKTWEDFATAGKKYTGATGKKFVAVGDQDWAYWWIIASAGGGFFDKDGNVVANNAFGVRVLTMLHDWVYKDGFAILSPGGSMYNQTYYGTMQQGEFAMQLGAPWYQGFMKDNAPTVAGKWRLQPLPKFADGSGARSATHGGTGTSIPLQSKNRMKAWDFVKFCNLTVDGVIKAFEMENLYPTYKPAWTDERLFRQDPYFDNQKPGEFIREVAEEMPPLYNSPYWPEVTDAFTRLVLTPVMQDKKPIKEAFDAFTAEVKRVMK
ncbi:MAG: ABC transporter substrate-binding protein [bacterium]